MPSPASGGFIAHWVDMLDPARDAVVAEHGHSDEAHRMLEREAVKVSLANLRSFPFVDGGRGGWPADIARRMVRHP